MSDRLIALSVAIALVLVDLTSAVAINLFVLEGTVGGILIWAYATYLAAFAVRGSFGARSHLLVGILMAAVIGGRAMGFVTLALERGDWSLTGAVAERLLIIAPLLMMWHYKLAKDTSHDTIDS